MLFFGILASSVRALLALFFAVTVKRIHETNYRLLQVFPLCVRFIVITGMAKASCD